MSGQLYIFIFGGVFLGAVALALLFWLLFWIGHRLEQKESGASHGFLELPKQFQSRPAPPSTPPPPPKVGE